MSDILVGIDEAGMGTLAGPLTVGVVVIEATKVPPGVRDSKKMSEEQREEVAALIMDAAEFYKVIAVEADVIDRDGISRCWWSAVRGAAIAARVMCGLHDDEIILDGNRLVGLPYVRPVVKADDQYPAVSAASILAKYTQCCWMDDYHLEYPEYGFGQSRGYPTPKHIACIRDAGALRGVHRKKFVTTVAERRNFDLRWG